MYVTSILYYHISSFLAIVALVGSARGAAPLGQRHRGAGLLAPKPCESCQAQAAVGSISGMKEQAASCSHLYIYIMIYTCLHIYRCI